MAPPILGIDMKKRKNINTSMIPYDKCFENSGIISSANGAYSKSYRVVNEKKTDSTIDLEHIYMSIAELYVGLKDTTFQFVIRNAVIDKEEYLKEIQIEYRCWT